VVNAKGLAVSALLTGLVQPQVAQAQSLTTLHNFVWRVTGLQQDGLGPLGDIAIHGDVLYGTTLAGGTSTRCDFGCGSVFRVNLKTGAETVLHSFDGGPEGAGPFEGVMYYNGALYGTMWEGGGGTTGFFGSVFKIDPDTGALTVLHRFLGGSDGGAPEGGLLEYNGKLYGTTTGGGDAHAANLGTLFEIDPRTGHETVLHTFSGPIGGASGDGVYPEGDLVQRGGKLFGATYGGGLPSQYGYGTIFKFDLTNGSANTIYRFTNSVKGDANPAAGLTLHNNMLYGTMRGGGGNECSPYGCGVVFSVAPRTGVQTVLEDLVRGRDGAAPSGPLVYHDGYLYGVSAAGGEYGMGSSSRSIRRRAPRPYFTLLPAGRMGQAQTARSPITRVRSTE